MPQYLGYQASFGGSVRVTIQTFAPLRATGYQPHCELGAHQILGNEIHMSSKYQFCYGV